MQFNPNASVSYMSKLPINANAVITLHFTHELIEALKHKPDGADTGDLLNTFEKRIGRFKYVIEVCTDHMVWVKMEPTARTWEGIAAQVEEINVRVRHEITRVVPCVSCGH
jgi:hypothetical protein